MTFGTYWSKETLLLFVNQDWDLIMDDFLSAEFSGIHANGSTSPDQWVLAFPDLVHYKKEWLRQADDFANTAWKEDLSLALHRVTLLKDIEINGHRALAHKKFIGYLQKHNGEKVPTNWETIYRCVKINGRWKIAGFTGYLPLATQGANMLKEVPASAVQHKTAGPYSPVLEVDPQKLVVISGQAAIDMEGRIIGETIEEQAELTFENCSNQLAKAGCTLDDVFKVNVYLTDLDDWPRFNEVYKKYFKEPLPVRTAVQTGLLMTLVVELEMWAVKPAK